MHTDSLHSPGSSRPASSLGPHIPRSALSPTASVASSVQSSVKDDSLREQLDARGKGPSFSVETPQSK